ncbi:hypothetical protein [Enterobacter phage N5822]|nr:hypothetical protein [Enterobacter phage N5822]
MGKPDGMMQIVEMEYKELMEKKPQAQNPTYGKS